jgi:hypothetical protein
MRRVLLFFGLGVFALGTLGPTLEALAPCRVPCVDEGAASDCAADQCCSCCVHSRLVAPDRLDRPVPLSPSSPIRTASAAFAPSADPREILHIPKPTIG